MISADRRSRKMPDNESSAASAIAMLPLDDDRWRTLKAYSGLPKDLPVRIERWTAAVGTEREQASFSELSERFRHQFTITDAAYAAVPHVVANLPRVPLAARIDYFDTLSIVEGARASFEAPECPRSLRAAYSSAIRDARTLAIEALSAQWAPRDFRYLLSAVAGLSGHAPLAELLWNVEARCECEYLDKLKSGRYFGGRRPR